MRRRVFAIAVFLVLGAIVNVAVAWGAFTWQLELGVTTGLRGGLIRDAQGKVIEHQTIGYTRSIGFPLRAFRSEKGGQPVHPIWPAFTMNSSLYAVLLWALYDSPGLMRRRHRIKRGLCPACAYPVGTSDVCTECGKPVKPRSVRPESGYKLRRRRIARGLCPFCTYPVGTSDVCTECGKPVKPQDVEPAT